MKNIEKKVRIACLNCGKRFDKEIWTEILIGEDLITDAIFDHEKINYFTCKKCGNKGFVCYPLTIIKGPNKATVIPVENSEFDVISVLDNEKINLFYDMHEIRHVINSWETGHDIVLDPPPIKTDIEEALNKSIITKEEAGILRDTDWEHFFDGIDPETMEVDWTDEQEKAAELYLRFMRELISSRKVVEFNKLKKPVPLSKDNLDEALSLIDKVFAYKEDGDLARINLQETLAGKNYGQSYWFVTDAKEKVIAMTGLYLDRKDKNDKKAVWLGWFGVHPDYRNRHLASSLLKFTMDEAVKRGFTTMKIYTSTDDTEKAANHLYKSYGFNQFDSSDDGEIVYYKKRLIN